MYCVYLGKYVYIYLYSICVPDNNVFKYASKETLIPHWDWWYVYIIIYMEVSIHGGSPKIMVYIFLIENAIKTIDKCGTNILALSTIYYHI